MSFENELRDHFDGADQELALSGGSLPAVKQRARQRTIRTRVTAGAVVLSLGAVLGATLLNTEEAAQQPTSVEADASTGTGTVSADDLFYLGAFLPPTDREEGDFGYGGRAAAFNPFGDPDNDDALSGSLFITGFPDNAEVAEISIPEPRQHDGTISRLPVAELLQPFADVTNGRADEFVGSTEVGGQGIYRIGGLEVVEIAGEPQLHWTAWQYLDVAPHDNPGHGYSSLDLSNPDPKGPWFLGDFEGYNTAGYVLSVPQSFADQAFGGRSLIAGHQAVSHSNGMSFGAPFFAYSADGAEPGDRLDPIELVNFNETDPQAPGFEPDSVTRGATWVETSDGRQAIVTVGNKLDLIQGDCSDLDPTSEEYGPRLSFYNPIDLAEVAVGNRLPYEVAPYLVSEETNFMIPTCGVQLTSVSFDAESRRLYVVQLLGSKLETNGITVPVIHVFEVS